MDSVFREFEKAQEAIRPLFDEIGTPQMERQAVIDKVVREVLQKFESIVSETRGKRDSLQEQCEAYIATIHELLVQLGMPQKELEHVSKLALNDRVAQLKVECERVESARNERLSQIKQLHSKLHGLWKSLKTPHSPTEFNAETDSDLNQFDPNNQFAFIDETLLDDSVVSQYQGQIDHWTKVRLERESQVTRLKAQVADLHRQLELNVVDSASDDCSFDRIAELTASVASLTGEREANRVQIEALCHDITQLWDALDTPAAERSRFPTTCSLSAISEVQATKERLIRLRQARMGDLCLHAVENLLSVFAELNRDGNATLDRLFPDIANQNWTEELLASLQEVTLQAREELDSTRGLRDLAARRAELREMKSWVEMRRKDPNRFSDRKGGRLLKQETDKSNLVSKHLKPVEMQLIRDIEAWEAEWQREFYFGSSDKRYAQCIVDDIQADIEAKKADKHSRAKKKKDDIENSMFINHNRTRTNMNKTVNTRTRVRVDRTPGKSARKPVRSRLPAPSKTPSRHAMPRPTSAKPSSRAPSSQRAPSSRGVSQTPSNLPRSRHHIQVSRVGPMTAPAQRTRPKTGGSSRGEQTTPIRVNRSNNRYGNVKSRIDTGRVQQKLAMSK